MGTYLKRDHLALNRVRNQGNQLGFFVRKAGRKYDEVPRERETIHYLHPLT